MGHLSLAKMRTRLGGSAAWLLLFTFAIPTVIAKRFISGISITGVTTRRLDVARTPALYTQDFGDCLGGQSLFNITKFDAAYYSDNSTVLFHLDGQSSIANESLMLRISLDAYGQNRLKMTFNPCRVNIDSLCPLDTSKPVTAWAVFPLGPQQAGDIPDLAFQIPDFEGSVKLQIFANSTKSEIGCFQARVVNGNTMAWPEIVSPMLAVFVLVAMLASFATAAYGTSITAMRTHYAHSLSVMVVFETFQSIFFSGALQLDFPSVLSAWWSNFAWSAGQIYTDSVVKTANIASGISSNSSQVGVAGPLMQNIAASSVLSAQQIYGRSLLGAHETYARAFSAAPAAAHQLSRRYNESDPYDYTWAGVPVNPGVSLPGTWTGFPGTLGALGIPAADTFAVGLIWLVILMTVLASSLMVLKFSLEALVKLKRIQEDRLAYFRGHWVQYTAITMMRMLFAAFGMVVTLAFFQLSFGGSAGTKAIASVFFLFLFLGLSGLIAHACYVRLRLTSLAVRQDRMLLVRRKKSNLVPYIAATRLSALEKSGLPNNSIASFPWVGLEYHDNARAQVPVTQDAPYIQRYGWLSARYRCTRWWFFALYLAYQLFRAAIVGGGQSHPQAQVYCLLTYDILAFGAFVLINPFEGRRNNALAVWMLGISKILTTALSIAFLPEMNTGRILATALGIIIIVIQGLLTIGVIVLIVLSAVSSHMSITRDRAVVTLHTRYLTHLSDTTADIHPTRAEKVRQKALIAEEEPPEPSFSVISVRRIKKIYDEDEATFAASLRRPTTCARPEGELFAQSGSLPRRARAVRASWNTSDFSDWDTGSEAGLVQRMSGFDGSLPRGSHAVRASWSTSDFSEWDDRGSEAGLSQRRSGFDGGVRYSSLLGSYQEEVCDAEEEGMSF